MSFKCGKIKMNEPPTPRLPLDIFPLIFEHLQYDCNRYTLLQCCLVSKSFLDLAGPILYRKITLFNNDGGGTDHVSVDGLLDPSSYKYRFKDFKEVLEIGYHSNCTGRCEDGKLVLPRLHTLKVIPLVQDTPRGLDHVI
ncbi:hypothetical protein I302_100456 [Kwoniella bestiolae CBS 10118]|uniref:F-box domain-containing protein n=1 Tax=Kwoniella bestiolae CBS 10118 TaxID=1296100 RepID=A0A1B9G573_9TREE|nr:hypothetical protein I302_03830 [Kwoniella bestiolae CBS 10118]OCF26152.1 hypothetical protein I302_03830 [Kwoniella bestiolae CBS 10118]